MKDYTVLHAQDLPWTSVKHGLAEPPQLPSPWATHLLLQPVTSLRCLTCRDLTVCFSSPGNPADVRDMLCSGGQVSWCPYKMLCPLQSESRPFSVLSCICLSTARAYKHMYVYMLGLQRRRLPGHSLSSTTKQNKKQKYFQITTFWGEHAPVQLVAYKQEVIILRIINKALFTTSKSIKIKHYLISQKRLCPLKLYSCLCSETF